jgi:hypothetical protein
MKNCRRLWIVVVVIVLGSGCSVKYVYNNADRFARWGVSDYLKMNEGQRRYFDAEFAKLHDWHRANHLASYSELLEALPATLADGIDVQEMTDLENTMLAWGEEMEVRGTPMVIGLARSMTDEQVARLAKYLEASNEEIAEPERGESLESSQEHWRDEIEDAFARFVGRLNHDQQRYLTSESVRYIPERTLWADYRSRWQADLLALLTARAEEEFAQRFTRLAKDREAYYGAELTHIFVHNETLSKEVAGWLLNNMTERQRERLFERLHELAVDFRELAAEAVPG